MRKEWILSIDHGITEPDAIQFLSELPNSEVRLANAEAVLNANLRPKLRFHNKLYVFKSRETEGAIGFFSGSANLTLSGLNFNNEQATAILLAPPYNQREAALSARMREQCNTLREIFLAGTVLDEELLQRYRGVWRPKRSSEDRTPLVRIINTPFPSLPIPKAIALSTASFFWIEIRNVVSNLGKGVPGNQIDLQRGSRVFFQLTPEEVRRNTVLGTVRIRYGGVVSDCHMRFGDNQMDKLNLPLPGTRGPREYRNQTLLFQRSDDGAFELRLGTPNDIETWKNRSREQGTLYRMQRGREYGVFR